MRSVGRFEQVMMGVDAPDSFEDQSFLDLYGPYSQSSLNPWIYEAAKRALDICGAIFGLTIFVLVLPVLLLLYFLKDPGPIFYKQQRVGKDMKPFTLYKLRTMIVDADAHLACHPGLKAAWSESGKLQNDPRITSLGSFLRRTSLDELPQFFNILRGDISLVGPRPIQYSEIPVFGELINLRQSVKPGLTGLWQIRGRSNTDYTQRAILDCIYVLDRSFWIDLLIIFKTFPAVLDGTDAF